MNEHHLIILTLVAVPLLVQNIVLMIQVNKLTNKVMSRNYGDYVQSEALTKPQQTGVNVHIPEDAVDTDINIMREYLS